MQPRKRAADNTRIPIRASKQRRTTYNHPDGGPSTPSQNSPLGARWFALGMDLISMMRDTTITVVDSFDRLPETAPMPHKSRLPPPGDASLPGPSSQPHKSIPSSTARQGMYIPLKPLGNKPSVAQRQRKARMMKAYDTSDAVASGSKDTQPGLQRQATEPVVPPPGLMTSPSTQASTSSIQPIQSIISQLYPEASALLEAQARLWKNSGGSIKRKYAERDHIHVKAHKQRMRGENEKTREELQQIEKEIYMLKRANGFGSDFNDFRSLLSYQARLEALDKQGPFSPSPSLTNLRERAQADKIRRHSFPDDVSSEFLQRALKKAQDVLQGPKPPKPFVPTLDQPRLSRLAKDAEIEEWLRSKEANQNKRHHFPDARFASGAVSASASRSTQDDNTESLQRALNIAQDVLQGPKPPKAFVTALDQLHLSWLAKDVGRQEQLRPTQKPLPSTLPPEDEAYVDGLFRKQGVVAKHVRQQVSDGDLSRLRPHSWLNDEVGSKENPATGEVNGGRVPVRKTPLDAYFFNSFFWSKLSGQGYEKARLARWTKKIDIFSKDVILIPVNHNNTHWAAAAINFRQKRVESYDSMGFDPRVVFKTLREYLDQEHTNKKKVSFDFTGWQDFILPNGFDCGVFTCQFLEALSRGEEDFGFTQANMPYLRRRMAWEIGQCKLREEP